MILDVSGVSSDALGDFYFDAGLFLISLIFLFRLVYRGVLFVFLR
ncbi:hypothetical protein RD1_3166 [Roseobacter denitrificans OCh 114]|uniref:Uncharacterized protein n=1 Tax=Roseobacter denitrificans (strain ATCC 33942 / OCh 114) TaxID=375451 RepID=Q164C0_ROSDO|nr:hypothetical protein RD1_3166 [Roseobacter denitrificans OCh 114]